MGLEDLHIALFQMTWGGNKVLKNVEIRFALRSLSVVLYHNDYVSWVACELYSPYFCLKVTTSDLLNFFLYHQSFHFPFFLFFNLLKLIFIWSFHFTEYTWSKKEKQTNKQNKTKRQKNEKLLQQTISKLIGSIYLYIYVQYSIVN